MTVKCHSFQTDLHSLTHLILQQAYEVDIIVVVVICILQMRRLRSKLTCLKSLS